MIVRVSSNLFCQHWLWRFSCCWAISKVGARLAVLAMLQATLGLSTATAQQAKPVPAPVQKLRVVQFGRQVEPEISEQQFDLWVFRPI